MDEDNWGVDNLNDCLDRCDNTRHNYSYNTGIDDYIYKELFDLKYDSGPPPKSKEDLLKEKKQKNIKLLESIDIEEIEEFVRSKKLKRITDKIKNK